MFYSSSDPFPPVPRAENRRREPTLLAEGVIEFGEALMQLDPARCGFGMEEVSTVEASWRLDDADFFWCGGFVVRLHDGRRAYIEGSRTPVYDEREPGSQRYTLHWEFDVRLIGDEPHGSLTPLQPPPPVSWEEAPRRLNDFLRRLVFAGPRP